MVVASPDVLMGPFTERIYRLPARAGAAESYLRALFMLLGYFNLLLGGVGLYLLQRGREEQDVRILRALIALTTLSYLGPVVFDNTVGTIGFFEIVEHVLFVGVLVVGAVVLARAGQAAGTKGVG